MIDRGNRKTARKRRHLRVRKKVHGTPERPRLNVFRSSKHMYAQIIDDTKGHTLVSASTVDPDLKQLENGANVEAAKKVGELIAKRAKDKGIDKVVFDRSGYVYHGRVKALAEAAREAGLNF
ncbi:MAG: 50S ribosomal protein L18 [Novibacillus thermophilus]|uniref:Large ribosomal subunit protein uL18 n=1 Tax=Novibacillus thermophilus TaxID=1471761 RepID=A0A1U9K3D3_9BACL|nr:50S ribosomal protein L18 [Novibacillus thermophilus]AQS54544.1 50S ribosomal protein L18 [Novibacillus thermophilus]